MEDIPLLAEVFLKRAASRVGIANPPRIGPGAIRELDNTIERALILYDGGKLCFNLPSDGLLSKVSNPDLSLDSGIREQIVRALRMTGGRVIGSGGAAEVLNINPSTLRSKMQRLKIYKGRFDTTRNCLKLIKKNGIYAVWRIRHFMQSK